jgi:hypothetical protein
MRRRRALSTALDDLRRRVQSAGEDLRAVEAYPTYRLVQVADLAGVSAGACRSAARDLETAWAGQLALVAHLEVLDSHCPGGRVRWGDEEVVRRLLEDATVAEVAVPHDSDSAIPASLLGDPGDRPHRHVADVLTDMSSAYENIVSTVRRVERVWSEDHERTAPAAADLAAAVQEATSCGVAPPRTAAKIATVLEELRLRMRSDPLAVSDDELDDAVRRAANAAGDLRRRVELHAAFEERTVEVAAAVATAGQEAWSATAARLEARRWVLEDGRLFVRASTTRLRTRADDLDEELRLAMTVADTDWELTHRRLTLVAAHAAGLVGDARACRRASLEAVGTRDRMRGRLDAFRAKAAGLGASDDDDLEQLHRAAVTELYHAPCDLGRAEAHVVAYVTAVEGLPAPAVVVAEHAAPSVAAAGPGGAL